MQRATAPLSRACRRRFAVRACVRSQFWLGSFGTYMYPMSIVVALLIAAAIGFAIFKIVKNKRMVGSMRIAAAESAAATMSTSEEDDREAYRIRRYQPKQYRLRGFSFRVELAHRRADCNDSIIGYIGRGLQYLFYPIFAAPNGFTSAAAQSDYAWRLVVAAITGLIAKEMVVATLGTMAGLDGDAILDGSR